MAKINNIHFNNFRNFTNYKISFEQKLNIFFGENGCGKTNILEGISLNSKGRGIRNSSISNLIKKKEHNFLIRNNQNHLILLTIIFGTNTFILTLIIYD